MNKYIILISLALASCTLTGNSEPTTVVATIYHAVKGQTDSTPFITASNSRINQRNPAEHRWIAVSRD